MGIVGWIIVVLAILACCALLRILWVRQAASNLNAQATPSPYLAQLKADPSTVTGAVIVGVQANQDASFLMAAPGTVKKDTTSTWQFYNVGTGYALQVSRNGVLDPWKFYGYGNFGSRGSNVDSFVLAKS